MNRRSRIPPLAAPLSPLAWGGGLRAAVFDLDGTLADSAPDIATALNATLAAAGLAGFDLARVKTMVGGGAATLVARALEANGATADEARVAALLDDFLIRYRSAACVETTLYPGTRQALDRLRGAGLALAICTNKPADLTEMVLVGLGIRGYFASVVPATPTLPPKPGPGMLLRVLEELGVPAAAAVMIGDSSADSGVARATGVRSILVRHGYSREPVDNLGADAVIDAFHELDGVLASLKRLPL